MADRGRGGPRAPDGVPRPAGLPFGRGPNRQDLAELPGSPGAPAPPLNQPRVRQGQVGQLREILGSIPLEQATGAGGLFDETTAPDEPVTAGAALGAGPGPEGLIPAPNQLQETVDAEDLKYAYPLILRLSTMPRATRTTKILAQRVRANLSIAPEQFPLIEHEGALEFPEDMGEPLDQGSIPAGVEQAAASPGAGSEGSGVQPAQQQTAGPQEQSAVPTPVPGNQS